MGRTILYIIYGRLYSGDMGIVRTVSIAMTPLSSPSHQLNNNGVLQVIQLHGKLNQRAVLVSFILPGLPV